MTAGKECVFKQIDGTVPPNLREIQRACRALADITNALNSNTQQLERTLIDDRRGSAPEFFPSDGVPIILLGQVAQIGRLARHLEKLFALDLESMKSPYMQRAEKDGR